MIGNRHKMTILKVCSIHVNNKIGLNLENQKSFHTLHDSYVSQKNKTMKKMILQPKLLLIRLISLAIIILLPITTTQSFGQQQNVRNKINTGTQKNGFSSSLPASQGIFGMQKNAHHGSQGGSRSATYIVDDGSSETSIGITGGGDMMWLNAFQTVSGAQVIKNIQVTWGTPLFPGLVTLGAPTRVILYEDPDDDGNPDDAVYLTEASTVVTNPDLDVFTTVPITPTAVSGWFFVAALYQNQLAGQYPAPLDQSPSAGTSWAVAESTPGGFDVNNLSNNTIQPILIDNAGYPGNWLLRAFGDESTSTSVPLSSGWIAGMVITSILVCFVIVRFIRK
jgi:hypothetical protein